MTLRYPWPMAYSVDSWLTESPIKLYRKLYFYVCTYGIGFSAELHLGTSPRSYANNWLLTAVGTSTSDAVDNLVTIVDQLYQRLDVRREELLATDAESYNKLRVLDTFLRREQP